MTYIITDDGREWHVTEDYATVIARVVNSRRDEKPYAIFTTLNSSGYSDGIDAVKSHMVAINLFKITAVHEE